MQLHLSPHVDKRRLARWYSLAASSYDTWGSYEGEEVVGDGVAELDGFIAMCDCALGEAVLDVGCGTGRVMLGLGGANVVGLDFSIRMLDLCRDKGGDMLVAGDAEFLPFRAHAFDLVTCMGVFEYYTLEVAEKILEELARVLKHSGRAVVDFPNIRSEESHKLKALEENAGNQLYLYERAEVERTIDMHFIVAKHNFVSNEMQYLLFPKKKNK